MPRGVFTQRDKQRLDALLLKRDIRENYITVKEAAVKLGISESRVRQLCRDRRLESITLLRTVWVAKKGLGHVLLHGYSVNEQQAWDIRQAQELQVTVPWALTRDMRLRGACVVCGKVMGTVASFTEGDWRRFPVRHYPPKVGEGRRKRCEGSKVPAVGWGSQKVENELN